MIKIKSFLKDSRKDTLKRKLYRDTSFGIFLSSLIGYMIFLISSVYFGFTFESFLLQTIFYIIMTAVILFVMDTILLSSIQRHIVNKLEFMDHELEEIKSGNLSKRLTIFGKDEIDQRSMFINSLLNDLEKSFEHEKIHSLIDPLTSSYNRRAFELDINGLLNKARRGSTNFVLAMLDIDDFKKFNDNYGHQVGDNVLIELTKAIDNETRSHDTLYRIGGEEFLLIMTDISLKDAKSILNRLRVKSSYHLKKNVDEVSEDITLSCGFVSSKRYDLQKEDIVSIMLNDADKLMYKAKSLGKNKVIP